MDWDEAKVSDVVNGKGGANLVEIAALLGACRVKSDERAHLLALHSETGVVGWWQQHGVCSPIELRTVVENLAVAETLTCWHTHAVPLFLQTADYMREALRASATSPADELEDRVQAGLAMQRLPRRGTTWTFFIHELALQLQVGGAEVQAGQLLHLMFMANRPNVEIRILPAARGAHAGLAGPFTLLTFPKYEPLVWVGAENSTLLAESRDAVAGYEAVIRALDAESLDEAESKELLLHLHDVTKP
ncbi:DUF5753 domain-containing protein [Lentzea sp. HUAS12]|uniref:DUF5753 domain-containing protein n=1 Tax=Lentzea sp. HUAS12 TaxID=2951806 RepID=UPI00209E9669|nr:DUF5753 domain-containing protein [Lentzea sp. HUAS12]USX49331.1 DUF5753 domain-containing protein [Lentzea sp. HUAS12]